MKSYWHIFLIGAFILSSMVGSGQKFTFRLENQVTGWLGFKAGEPITLQAGGRYIPVVSIGDTLRKDRVIDAELSCKAYGNLLFRGNDYDSGDQMISPYRLWVRYVTPRLEIRAGLQKINFGSASILRPLMWFDQMDSRDPLQITDGVYGLLGRYYFTGNTNVWLWGLYGNHKVRGWEFIPGVKTIPEFGGRLQVPVVSGEAALTFHRRKADYTRFIPPTPVSRETRFFEEKIGFDGKWDIGPGISLEAVAKHNDPDNGILPEWETWLNAGLDYTLPLGNGLSLATEFLRYRRKTTAAAGSGKMNYSVVTCSYPFGMVNNAMALVYYDWDNKNWYRFISLKREYDFWSFYLMAFWNPEDVSLYSAGSENNLFAGKGFQLMAVVNF